MLQLLLEVLGEVLLQVIGQILVELGLHAIVEPFRRPPNPFVAAIGYILLGAIFGGFSLLAFSTHMIGSRTLQVLNLVVSPIAAGLSMMVLAAWRTKRGQSLLRIDTFSYGFLFALAFACIRFQFAK